MWDHTQVYYDTYGLSLIPLSPRVKYPPAVKWKRYQSKRVTKQTLRKWVLDRGYQLAALMGDISGGIVSRDFDSMEAYQRWAERHASLASTLPTMLTARGKHVFAVMNSDEAFCASAGKQYVGFGDGEFRVGSGCYCLLPPAMHPNGIVYQWEIPPNGSFPRLHPNESGFARAYVETGEVVTQQTQQTQAYTGRHRQDTSRPSQEEDSPSARLRDASVSVNERLGLAISETLPTGPGQRNRQLLVLARYIKAIPECARDSPSQLRNVVKAWHKQALPVIRTKEFEETWMDFVHAWQNVRLAIGEGAMCEVVHDASLDDLPEIVQDYDRKEARLLVAVCRELQRRANRKPFYLSCRTAGDLVDIDHQTAARWLRMFVVDGILKETSKGSIKGHKASEYQYIGG